MPSAQEIAVIVAVFVVVMLVAGGWSRSDPDDKKRA